MTVSFETKCVVGVRNHDHVYINNIEYTVIEAFVGGSSAIIVAHNGEKIQLSGVCKHDHIYINNIEYTVIEMSFGGISAALIVAQHCNGEKFEMLLKRTDMSTPSKRS